MKRIFFAVVFVIVIILAQNSYAQIIYENDFSSGNLPTYLNATGTWEIRQDGTDDYLFGDTSSYMTIGIPDSARPIRFEARVRMETAVNQNDDEYIRALGIGLDSYANEGYALDIDTGANNPQYVHLMRWDTELVSLASSSSVDFRDMVWHDVAIELYGNGTVKAFYDNVEYHSVFDSTYNNFNVIYFSTSQQSAYAWDNISVSVVPEPISSTLFIIGGGTLGFRRFRKKFKK